MTANLTTSSKFLFMQFVLGPDDLTKSNVTFFHPDPCAGVSCGKGSCRTENHVPICYCQPGFQPQNNQCVDVDECALPNTCHASAVCKNTPGSFTCACPEAHVGDPFKVGCKPRGECVNDRDCPSASACREGRCIDPCVGFCGTNALCSAVNHQVNNASAITNDCASASVSVSVKRTRVVLASRSLKTSYQ